MEVKHSKQAIKDLNKLKSNPMLAIKYKVWEETVEDHGYLKLREVKAYEDKEIEGATDGTRRSKLNRGFRVFYRILNDNAIEV